MRWLYQYSTFDIKVTAPMYILRVFAAFCSLVAMILLVVWMNGNGYSISAMLFGLLFLAAIIVEGNTLYYLIRPKLVSRPITIMRHERLICGSCHQVLGLHQDIVTRYTFNARKCQFCDKINHFMFVPDNHASL